MPKPGKRPQFWAAAAALVAGCLAAGCNTPAAHPSVLINTGTPATAVSSETKFQPTDHEPFDGDRAFEILKKQCSFGVRPLGSDAHDKARDYLISQMKLYANEVKLQQFKYRGMTVTNIVGVFYPAGSSAPAQHPMLLMTHWDSRPIADGPFSSQTRAGVHFKYGPEGWKPTAPIMGANDGASGPGVLLELARIFKAKAPPVGVVMLLDDGEDYGDFNANNRAGEGVELGARYFAKTFRQERSFGQPSYGILLDMVGAKNAFFVPEELSVNSAPNFNRKVFAIGRNLGYGSIFRSDNGRDFGQSVGDDHVSINEAGIPTIDLIHPLPFGEYEQSGYTYWHTQQDTVDKCSPETLKAVGDTIADTVYREAPAQ